MSQRPSLIIHCQYLYGIGHFVRATELARSLQKEFDVRLVTGGERIANFAIPSNITVHQLPAIFRDEASGRLIPVDSSVSLESCLAQREKQLAQLVQTWRPDIVITEHFPFGLLFEEEVVAMLGLIRQIKPGAMIVSSVRDVIDSALGGRNDLRICSLLEKWFDLILVHGDARAIPLQASFPLIDQITTPYVYTGYVVATPEPRHRRSAPPILVGSIGGGRLGQELLSALRAAHQLLVQEWNHELFLFQGAFDLDTPSHSDLRSLKMRLFDRTEYRQLLAQADGVICLGGYNSVAESLSMALPTLVYKRKFLASNREQALRADFLRLAGLIRTVEDEDLAPRRLAHHMRLHFGEQAASTPAINFQGAENTCRILLASWHANQLHINI
jgi:predicted glycosyltransferase